MHLLAGLLISGLLIGMPLAFQVNIPQPPANATGWLSFTMLLGGVLTLIGALMSKLIIAPAIESAIKVAMADIPTRKEFEAHVETDEKFQTRVDGFLENYYEGSGPDSRRHARRRGDPQ